MNNCYAWIWALLLLITSPLIAGERPVVPLTHYKSGISLLVEGEPGVDYAFERFYHDPRLDDRGVIYLRAHTMIRLEHNDQNFLVTRGAGASGRIIGRHGEDGMPDSGDEGVIRMKVDMDRFWGLHWSNGNIGSSSVEESHRVPRYSGPFSFQTLTYFDGTPVLGAVGQSAPISHNAARVPTYWRGIIDEFGDEWHILTVGDDDQFIPNHDRHKYDCWSSDGKIFLFVVNPKTPALGFLADGPAQYYTTPAKNYFIPHIHPQITYLTAGVRFFFTNLTDPTKSVQYRIDEINGREWKTYQKPIAVDSLGLKDDTRYTLRFRIGADGPEKTRTLHFQPGYPSDRERHPSPVLFRDEQQLALIRHNIQNLEVHRRQYARMLEPVSAEQRGNPGQGLRTAAGTYAASAAFPIFLEGVGKYPHLEKIVREELLDNWLVLDPIGVELLHNLANPCRERVYHGYYYAGRVLNLAVAYDLVIRTLRPEKSEYGFTAIEDLKIRDLLANFALETMSMRADYPLPDGWPSNYRHTPDDLGMWSTARQIALHLVAMILPSYDSHYYGTSGADGKTQATHVMVPFAAEPRTWFAESAYHIPAHGPLAEADPPVWGDRGPYFNLMNWLYAALANARYNFDGTRFPHVERAYWMAMKGELKPTKHFRTDAPVIHTYSALMMNESFPELAREMEQRIAENEAVVAANKLAKAEGRPLQPQVYDGTLSQLVQGVFGICYCRPLGADSE